MTGDAPTLLVAGTSHCGKTTLAAMIGDRLGWSVLSTDSLGRHPGRPWPEVRPHVADFYANLADESIYQLLLHHYENIWPVVLRTIHEYKQSGMPLILEGSALRPDLVSKLAAPNTMIICLHADPGFLRDRMRHESGRERSDPTRQIVIDKFIERSLRDNSDIVKTAKRFGLRCIDAGQPDALDEFVASFLCDYGVGALPTNSKSNRP